MYRSVEEARKRHGIDFQSIPNPAKFNVILHFSTIFLYPDASETLTVFFSRLTTQSLPVIYLVMIPLTHRMCNLIAAGVRVGKLEWIGHHPLRQYQQSIGSLSLGIMQVVG